MTAPMLIQPRRRVLFEDGPHPAPFVITCADSGLYLGAFLTERNREDHAIRSNYWPVEENVDG